MNSPPGGWGGDHGWPTAACASGDEMILAWFEAESGWAIIKTDLDGRKKWGSKDRAWYLATDGRRIFAGGGRDRWSKVVVYDGQDGRPINFGNEQPSLQPPPRVARRTVDLEGTVKVGEHGFPEAADTVTGLAYHKGTIYVSYRYSDLIGVYDADSGRLKTTWSVTQPGSLAARKDGTILAVSGGRVVSVTGGQVKPLVADHLDEPSGIAVDSANHIYVANRGTLHNIAVFDGKGRYVRSIGKKGGRPWRGRFDPSGMLVPGQIAVDKEGKLWVPEILPAPKRVSVWDTETGELITEFFGASAYSTWAYMDPDHPDEIYCHNVQWKVDLDKGTWKPHSTIWRGVNPNEPGQFGDGGYQGHLRVATATGGRQFAFGISRSGETISLKDGDVFKPFLGAIWIKRQGYGATGNLFASLEDEKEFPDGFYVWQDANNDQAVQRREVSTPAYVDKNDPHPMLFSWVDKDMNVRGQSGYLFRPVRFEGGRPVYDVDHPERIPFDHWKNGTLWLGDDAVYTLSDRGDQGTGLSKWTPGGKLLWQYPGLEWWVSHLGDPVQKPGDLWGSTMPLGTAGGFTGFCTYIGTFHLFTDDGIYVDMIFRDARGVTGALTPDMLFAEMFSGQLVQPKGSDRYFLLAGDQDGRVVEILGLDSVKRLNGGTYTLTEPDAKKAADALASYESRKAKQERLVIVRGRDTIKDVKGVTRTVDDQRRFTVRAGYDKENLYILYDVDSPADLVNSIADHKIIFKGGNLLDVQMATGPKAAPDRQKPAPGDIRILVSRQQGKPIAIVYRPEVAGFQGEPFVMRSPTGTEPFDSIQTSDQIGLDYQKREGGFRATVTVPLAVIAWTPRPGTQVKMDLGYIFGNSTGMQTTFRAYLYNNSFTANVTSDIPHESRLEPHEWGVAFVE